MNSELVVIDSRLRDSQYVQNQLSQGYTVLLLNDQQDGLTQILDFLHQQADSGITTRFDALHLVSHGATGEIQLGSTVLNSAALAQHQGELVELAKLLAVGADLMVYGCDVAQGVAGQAFVTQLAKLSGLDVAASTGLTGSVAVSGEVDAANWVLETSVGNLQATTLQLNLSENLAAPTGLVTITGMVGTASPTQGQKLTAVSTLADADGMGTVSYQWYSGATAAAAISATATAIETNGTASYTLTQADVGKYFAVKASYTDGKNTPESKFSAATKVVLNVNDNPTGAVTITGMGEGNPTQGQELTADSSTLDDLDGMGAVSYQWYSGATAAIAVSSTATAIAINGKGATYTLTQADVGKFFSVKASYKDLTNKAESKFSAATTAVQNVNDDPTGEVTITGTAAQGQDLTADSTTLADLDGMGTVSYQWYSGATAALAVSPTATAIETNGTAAAYTLTQADVGKYFAVKASYTDLQKTAESKFSAVTTVVVDVNDAPTGAVTITGTAAQNSILTAASTTLADLDGMGPVSYQWYSGNTAAAAVDVLTATAIATNGTAATYTLTQADVGKYFAVKASYTDGLNKAESKFSAATTVVANVNDNPTGTVTITGTAAQNATLTAKNTLADLDGMGTVSYQWYSGATAAIAISATATAIETNGTGATYKLTQGDVGRFLAVKASYTDLTNKAESKFSAATKVVANANDLPTGEVTITGKPTQGQELTADISTLDDLDGLGAVVTYQWLANNVDITGATAKTYTPTQAEVDKVITVKASYIDGFKKAEFKLSAATAKVQNVNDEHTGTVTITGTPTQHQTLTAVNDLADLDGIAPGAIKYQWLANGVAIGGATGSTLTLGQPLLGKSIKVVASYTDGFGNNEVIDSESTANVTSNALYTGSLTIGGTRSQGQTLSAISTLKDADGMGALSYQWNANGVAIDGATAATYKLTQSEVSKTMTVSASYTDGKGGKDTITSSATTAIANVNDAVSGTVTITGTPTQNQTLTAVNDLADLDGIAPGAIKYQWLANGAVIAGATDATYMLTQAQVGKTITVNARYTDGLGALESKTSSASAVVANVNDLRTGDLSISGSATQGQTLSANNTLADADGLGTIRYQWLANGVAIKGANLATYKLTQTDVNKSITLNASYTDRLGFKETKDSDAREAVANVNDAATGTVTIAGKPTQGQTLSARHTLADIDGMDKDAVSYQWKANGVAIEGATTAFHTLTQDQVNKKITVTASFTDTLGGQESKTSVPTSAVANVNDRATGTVTINGTPTQNQILTATYSLTDIDGPIGQVSYQWLANGKAISGATTDSYMLLQGDVNKTISVKASYTDAFGFKEAMTSSASTPVKNANDVATGTVTISGTATQNQTLTASNTLADLDGLGTVRYQWRADNEDIAGANLSTYKLTQSEVRKSVSVVASYTDGFGTPESVESNATTAVVNVNDAVTGSVKINGIATQGEELTVSDTLADLDGIAEGAINYQWRAGGVAIAGATSDSFILTQAQVNKAVTVIASYTDGSGTKEFVISKATTAVVNVNDDPTGGIMVNGQAEQGQTLTADHTTLADLDGLGTLSYQWLADGVAIMGATAATYVLGQGDVGKSFSVWASYTDGFGFKEVVKSDSTDPVANVNDKATGEVLISGDATQFDTLTATNTLADLDGMGDVHYQWLADGLEIEGAQQSTYTLTQDEVNKTITVVARYVDELDTEEAVTSAATAAVANVNDGPTGGVTIEGAPEQYQTLTVSHNLEDVDGMGEVRYQWRANGVDIENATGEYYELTQGDVGKTLTVSASYTDGFGKQEQLSSAQTEVVLNVNDAVTGEVMISGMAVQGETLTASHDLQDMDGMMMEEVRYQWYADGEALDGKVGSTYQLGQEDVGKSLSVSASYTDDFEERESVSSFETGQVDNVNDPGTGQVTVQGDAKQGETLTASYDLQDQDGMGDEVSYQWSADGVDIEGASDESYELSQDDVGKVFTVTVRYTDESGEEESKTSGDTMAVANVNDEVSGEVSIDGTPLQGETLTVSHSLEDIDGMGEVHYQWFADGVQIEGANSDSYQLVQADVGRRLSVQASYTDDDSNPDTKTSTETDEVGNVNDAVSGSLTISGRLVPGETLEVSHNLTDADGMGMGEVRYQWYADGVEIMGAVGSSYLLSAGDVGHSLVVMASYIDALGSEEVVQSAPSEAVAYVNHLTTGSLTISGTPELGEVMTVTSQLDDADGIGELSYQWFSDGLAIEGAVGEQFQMTAAELGTKLSVGASYTDGLGNLERFGYGDSIDPSSPVTITFSVAMDGASELGGVLVANKNTTLKYQVKGSAAIYDLDEYDFEVLNGQVIAVYQDPGFMLSENQRIQEFLSNGLIILRPEEERWRKPASTSNTYTLLTPSGVVYEGYDYIYKGGTLADGEVVVVFDKYDPYTRDVKFFDSKGGAELSTFKSDHYPDVDFSKLNGVTVLDNGAIIFRGEKGDVTYDTDGESFVGAGNHYTLPNGYVLINATAEAVDENGNVVYDEYGNSDLTGTVKFLDSNGHFTDNHPYDSHDFTGAVIESVYDDGVITYYKYENTTEPTGFYVVDAAGTVSPFTVPGWGYYVSEYTLPVGQLLNIQKWDDEAGETIYTTILFGANGEITEGLYGGHDFQGAYISSVHDNGVVVYERYDTDSTRYFMIGTDGHAFEVSRSYNEDEQADGALIFEFYGSSEAKCLIFNSQGELTHSVSATVAVDDSVSYSIYDATGGKLSIDGAQDFYSVEHKASSNGSHLWQVAGTAEDSPTIVVTSESGAVLGHYELQPGEALASGQNFSNGAFLIIGADRAQYLHGSDGNQFGDWDRTYHGLDFAKNSDGEPLILANGAAVVSYWVPVLDEDGTPLFDEDGYAISQSSTGTIGNAGATFTPGLSLGTYELQPGQTIYDWFENGTFIVRDNNSDRNPEILVSSSGAVLSKNFTSSQTYYSYDYDIDGLPEGGMLLRLQVDDPSGGHIPGWQYVVLDSQGQVGPNVFLPPPSSSLFFYSVALVSLEGFIFQGEDPENNWSLFYSLVNADGEVVITGFDEFLNGPDGELIVLKDGEYSTWNGTTLAPLSLGEPDPSRWVVEVRPNDGVEGDIELSLKDDATIVDANGDPLNLTGVQAAPSVPVDTLEPASPTVALGPDVSGDVTREEAAEVTGVVTIKAEVGTSVVVSFTKDGDTVFTKTVDGAGDTPVPVVLSPDDVIALGYGAVVVSAVATDAVGNDSNVGEFNFTMQLPNYAPAFDTTGLVAYWKMDEGTGTVAQDSGPNGLDANLKSGASWANTGAPGLATDSSVSLNNDYLQVADSQRFNLSSGFTISAWAKPSDHYDNVIIDRGENNLNVSIRPNDAPGLGFYFKPFGWLTSGTPIDANEWVHVAVSWDPDTRDIKFYKDGLLTDTFFNIQTLDFGLGELNIGRQNPYYSNQSIWPEQEMNGLLDEVAIFDHALSVSEISSLMQEGLQTVVVAFADHGEGVAYQAVATDVNAGTALTYGLLDSTDAALFTIDAATGAVRFKVAPDMAQPRDAGVDNIYNLTVTASDGVNIPTELAVAIEVRMPPSMAPTATEYFIENTDGVVYTAQAVGSNLTYTLAGVDAALFAIDAGTGEMRFVNIPDYETRLDAGQDNVYDVAVVATDTYKLQASQQVSVSLYGVYEIPVMVGDSSAQTAENSTGTVYTAHAVAEAGYTLTYALGGDDAALFTIDARTGAVAFAEAPNFEAPLDVGRDNRYDLTVMATDMIPSAPKSVVIEVTNVVEPSAVNVTVSPAQVPEGDAANLVYTFTRSGDIDGALTVNIGYGGDANLSADYANEGPFSKSWSTLVGGSSQDKLLSITATPDGGFYAVGQGDFYSPSSRMISADGVPLPFFGEADAFISKYNASGVQLWTRVYGAAGTDEATSVAVDSAGSAYVVGYGNGTGGTNTTFIAKYSPTGGLAASWELTNLQPTGWDKRSVSLSPDESAVLILSTSNNQRTVITEVPVEPNGFGSATSFASFSDRVATAMATTSDGLVYLTGYTQSSIEGQINDGGADAFISQLNTTGAVVWTRLIGGTGEEFGTSVDVGSDGAVYVAGGSGTSIFLNKFDTNGNLLWEKTIANGRGADDSNYPCSLAIGSDGFVYLSGTTTSGFDGQQTAGDGDAFLSRIDPGNGQTIFTQIMFNTGDDRATAIAAGPNGEILIGGTAYKFYDEVYDNLQGMGSLDGFVTQFAPPSLPSTVTFAAGSTTATLTIKSKVDAETENPETVTVTVLAGQGYDVGTSLVATGTIEDNLPPAITSDASASVAENTSGTVYTAQAKDANAGSTLTYALGGTDAARFTINAATGAVAFANAPDFKAPTDDGGDNVYNISVTASDGVNTSAAQAVAITVSDVVASVNVTVAPAQVLEGDQTDLVYTFTRSGDTSGALAVNLGVGGTATADDYTPKLALSGSVLPTVQWTRLIGGSSSDSIGSVFEGSDGAVYVAGSTNSPTLDGQTNPGQGDGFVSMVNADGTVAWTRLIGGSSFDNINSVFKGSDGAVYVAGSTSSETFDGQTNQGQGDGFVSMVNADGTVAWTRLIGGSSYDYINSAFKGSDGAVYVTGNTSSETFDGQTNQNQGEGFVSRFNADGTVAWTRLIGGSSYDYINSAFNGSDGAVYVAGYTTSPTLDGQTVTGQSDGFVSMVNADGTVAWTRLIGGSSDDYINSAFKGSDGAVYVAGYTASETFDGQTNQGQGDGFVSMVNADGTVAWTRLIGGSSYEYITSAFMGSDGAVYVAGYTNSPTLDGQTVTGQSDGFVSRFNADGTVAWTRLIGGSSHDVIHSAFKGSDGAVYVAGYTTSPTLDGQTVTGQSDGFVSMVNADGTVAWTRLIGGSSDDSIGSAFKGSDGAVYVAGYTYIPTLDGQAVMGGSDGFVSKIQAASSTQITFAPGSDTATLAVQATADQLSEDPETLTVSVLAGNGYTLGTDSVATGTIEDNLPPVIISADSASVEENTTGTVYTASATDANVGITLTYALSGTDAMRFTIDASTGAVAFANAPDFEAPTDDGGDNVYSISVTASDGVNTSAAQAVAITVSDALASVHVTVAPAQVLEGDQTDLVYTFTRSGDTGGALTVNLGVGGTASANDYQTTPLLDVSGSPTKEWTRLFGSSSDEAGFSIATSSDGAVYVAGQTPGSLDGYSFFDAFISKYGADGTAQWTRQVGGEEDDRGYSVATGLDGSVYLAGTTSGSIDGQTSNGATDAFVTKFAADGTKQWTRLTGGIDSDTAQSVSVADDGSVYIVGTTNGSIDGQLKIGNADAFVTKYSADGVALWTKLVGGTGDDLGYSVATGSDGSIYVAGQTYGSMDGQTNQGDVDGFISKYSADGTKEWTKLVGGASWDHLQSVATGADGAVYVTGSTGGAIDGESFGGLVDSFITKFAADGSKEWTRLSGEARTGRFAMSVAVDAQGFAYVAGNTDSSIEGQLSNGFIDGFVTKYSADGAKIWTRLAGGTGAEMGGYTAVGSDGSVYLAGHTNGSIDGQLNLDQTNTGSYDAYITKFAVAAPQITFAAGASTATLTVHATVDQLIEGNETVTVTVLAGQGYALATSLAATGTIADNLPPVITSAASASVAENTSGTVYTAQATDANVGSTLTYALSGTDATRFTINATTGAVAFANAPDFEAPRGSDGGNVYNISVTASDGVNTSVAQAVAITVTDVGEAGESVIDLGSYGRLIAPVQVEGKWYYHWDRSGDGTSADTGSLNGSTDKVTHDELDSLFNHDSAGVSNSTAANEDGQFGTTDIYRYATLNGVDLALLTISASWEDPQISTFNTYYQTRIGSTPAINGSDAVNPIYDDLVAVWDAYNGVGNEYETRLDAIVPGWQFDNYWAATEYQGIHKQFSFVNGSGGVMGAGLDSDLAYVALQVL